MYQRVFAQSLGGMERKALFRIGASSVERAATELVQSRGWANSRQLRFYKLAPHDFALCKIASAKSSGLSP
jgi:hypothetical protein